MRRHTWWPGDDAVSPVIGVVLLVGIAVALTASIGLFVLGAGPGDQAPRGEVQFAQHGDNVTVTVIDGDGLFADELSLIVGADDACLDPTHAAHDGWSGSLDPGDRVVVNGSVNAAGSCDDLNSSEVVRLVWSPEGGSRTEVLGEYEVA